MVEEIEKLARLLDQPGMEPETAKMINETIREQLAVYRKQTEAATKGTEHLHNLMVGPMFSEWINGIQPDAKG